MRREKAMAPPGAPSTSTSTAGVSGDGSTTATSVLTFERWQSSVTGDFWQSLANLKLDTLHLSQRPLEIQGYFAPCSHAQVSKPLQLNYESLASELNNPLFIGDRNQCPVPGTLYNTNTMDEFNSLDKKALLKVEAQKIWMDICCGRAEEDCKLLNRFFVISYADLKDWKFKYWFCFPALKFPEPVKETSFKRASDYFAAEEHPTISAACMKWREAPSTTCLPFFLLHFSPESVRARPLSDWAKCQEDGGKLLLGLYDPCNRLTSPGWLLRNFLALAASRWGLKDVTVLCWREMQGRTDLRHCFVATISLPELQGSKDINDVPEAVGWEQNARVVNLASSMDPNRLAKSAADLNLKLMKWRSFPSLNLEMLSKTKCLLLGAGTLGCQVARNLMAWGIRDITFVDYGRVGFSNPLRQSLYRLEDCVNGGRMKAEAAADFVRSICADVRAHGEQLAIPMAGHSVAAEQVQATLDSFNRLKSLIEEHDIIFLLTDTRESRWLPTLLCAAADRPKIAINSALGFDSFVVMRHGDGPFRSSQHPRLGCYFCNDVVAPADSTANRTLDQQCTVSRPGIASIAAALAVELAVGVLHHPLGIAAPADPAIPVTAAADQPLGILPHQMRGFISHFAQLVVSGLSFDGCTACSAKVVTEFKQRGFEFILDALNSPNYLEDLTGLTELLNATKSMSLDWDEAEEDVPDMQ